MFQKYWFYIKKIYCDTNELLSKFNLFNFSIKKKLTNQMQEKS